ncbi:hypothetical protein [Thalassoroseus pseudoceratinae]|uniref:hypothetical protein n=1 Tax=Thalassoroseus pseudoceratinae TaxID=2713176 RepID=UPI00141EC61F|nr:hypothetical protein [Thalassoroseus pseudoceratinae]
MRIPKLTSLVIGALCIFAVSSAEASILDEAAYRERTGVSSTKDGVTHQASVSAGLDERSGFDVGIFADDRNQKGQQKSKTYGDRNDERWFAGARGGVQAGAFADATASQSGQVGNVEIENYAQGETFVGSEAGVEAGISNNGLGLGANAFTGGRATGRLGTEIGPAGAAATGEAWSGLGAEAGVNLSMDDGKLKLGGELGAALGVGGKLGAEITIDTKPIGKAAKTVGTAGKKAGQKIGQKTKKLGRNVGRAGKNAGRAIAGLFRKKK